MKICIIKLGAKGDVIRTIPVAKAIKEKYKDSEITWITKSNISDILKTYKFLNQIETIPFSTAETFDILYNFDIEKEATDLAKIIRAEKKQGFYQEGNYVEAFNLGAEYYLNTLFDDEIKKSNRLTYQEMMFRVAEIPCKEEIVQLILPKQALDYADNFLNQNNLSTEKLIGIHLGASPRWPSKAWHEDRVKEFITKAKQKNCQVILFGGQNESDKLASIAEELGVSINNPNNTNLEFASLIDKCKTIICADSFALHLSLALKKPTIGLFFVTSPNEVEPYNLLKKITSPLLKDFFPEKSDLYDEELVKSISSDNVLDVLAETLF
ncbi:glycosyltransferase family 9 protein [Candidatus Pacearchaeota archaeon]|nr:glycosyltransferase family 9 protein [Candidatus Pacearchaeota archaeon]